MRLTLFFLSFAVLLGCKTTAEVTPTRDAPLVVLKRTACQGRCPAYTVTVATSGALSFEPASNTLAKEKVSAMLEPAKVKALSDALSSSAFSTWKSEYVKSTTADQPTVELTVGGRTIRHSLGDESAPAELKALEEQVDALTGTSQWTTGAGAPAM